MQKKGQFSNVMSIKIKKKGVQKDKGGVWKSFLNKKYKNK